MSDDTEDVEYEDMTALERAKEDLVAFRLEQADTIERLEELRVDIATLEVMIEAGEKAEYMAKAN